MLSFVSKCLTWIRRRVRAQPVTPHTQTHAPVAVTIDQQVPAVAGFVSRLPPPPADFHLSARLASVAHLNTRSGRVPALRGRRPAAAKAVPKLVPATRKRSPIPHQRVRPTAPTVAPIAADVVAMAKQPAISRCIPLDIRIELAA